MNFARPKLDDLAKLAFDAAREILAVREAGFETIRKTDGSPVTVADQSAEAVIEAGLKQLVPGAPMVGEESAAAGRIPDPGSHFFSVDPLDGTRDFVAGGEEFTVNIGWIENGLPVSGVVLSPVSGELYLGEPGRALRGVYDMKTGAMREDLRAIHTRTEKPASGWRVFTSRHSGKNTKTANFIEALGAATPAYSSSSIKFCRLAEGAADLYPRFGTVNEWDVAAGHAVLLAAGGDVMHLHGAPLRYGALDGVFEVRGLIAYANEQAAEAARAAVASMPNA